MWRRRGAVAEALGKACGGALGFWQGGASALHQRGAHPAYAAVQMGVGAKEACDAPRKAAGLIGTLGARRLCRQSRSTQP